MTLTTSLSLQWNQSFLICLEQYRGTVALLQYESVSLPKTLIESLPFSDNVRIKVKKAEISEI